MRLFLLTIKIDTEELSVASGNASLLLQSSFRIDRSAQASQLVLQRTIGGLALVLAANVADLGQDESH